MATTELISYVRPQDFVPEAGFAYPPRLVQVGGLVGYAMNKLDTQGVQFEIRVPALGTPLSTGLTFQTMLVDDPNNSDPGKVVHLGITVKLLATGADSLVIGTAGATEQLFDVTMPATSGLVILTSTAIANANLDTAVAGARLLIRVRRNGSHANDTHKGRVVLGAVSISDT